MKARPVFPFAVTLRAAALIFEGDGRPALYVCAEDHRGHARPFRTPPDARVTLDFPRTLPAAGEGKPVFLPAGSHANFETPDGARTVLSLHAVRVARELLEALEAYGEALTAWHSARQVFEGEGAA